MSDPNKDVIFPKNNDLDSGASDKEEFVPTKLFPEQNGLDAISSGVTKIVRPITIDNECPTVVEMFAVDNESQPISEVLDGTPFYMFVHNLDMADPETFEIVCLNSSQVALFGFEITIPAHTEVSFIATQYEACTWMIEQQGN